MTLREEALKMHKEKQGKLGVHSKVEVQSAKDLSLAYSPGVAEPCLEIAEDAEKIYDYTMKGNLVGVVSNGTAVLGLGNIGAGASMPVMEGKALLFKSFANVDAFPICLNTEDPDKVVETVKLLEPTFGGINLEDIAAPYCFEIEERLKQACNIPIFHDDQHGTAIVTAAGLLNALRLANKKLEDIKVVANGAGAAGVAIVKLLLNMGVQDVILCDTKGIIYEGRPVGMNPFKEEMARMTNKNQQEGTLADALVDADVFVGVSAAGAVTQEMIRSMNDDSIIFAMANPVPEIMPEEAKEAGALVIGTGRSDFPNQVNNVLAFPGIFRGALDVQAKEINEEMKVAAVYAIAGLIDETNIHADYVIPDPFDKRVAAHVAAAVAKAAMDSGVARKPIDVEGLRNKMLQTNEVPELVTTK
ncbi:NAD-dependent malic enzyme [Priestia flexa]|uniref:Malate dehydrogenase n=2 Tax=Priestia TaxID=2800373 RepID=A0A0V8JKF7_9BACI|nr:MULTISPECIES: malic enzyme-like NAD(P)-binding protein [Bacillaceae]KSU87523.1 malate dehydrogenase [Priestia veravalensis]KZB92327.1 malate dehydrogenase [Bacillus sp. VT 712]MBN8251609.1 NAD-dependent malic enzyme [Priestia flexa]MBN8436073.1 NAD-dependent malic enzyme [Priestia flexa]MCA0968631.1 NAD-dependent malic enzyme [Priestia flexa]